jgi:DNA repair protein RecN (Recombination protein N)
VLRRLLASRLRDRRQLEVDSTGFYGADGETGAGKSILVDALAARARQPRRCRRGARRRGARGDQRRVRCSAELAGWLDEAGFEAERRAALLLRRTIDAQGKSRAWVNGSPATIAQLREAADTWSTSTASMPGRA